MSTVKNFLSRLAKTAAIELKCVKVDLKTYKEWLEGSYCLLTFLIISESVLSPCIRFCADEFNLHQHYSLEDLFILVRDPEFNIGTNW